MSMHYYKATIVLRAKLIRPAEHPFEYLLSRLLGERTASGMMANWIIRP